LEATVVRWIMAKLLPDMSSTFMVFQTLAVFVSPLQAKEQSVPSLKESPGPGADGTGSARAVARKERKRAESGTRSIFRGEETKS
jgi:hypothetical protein